MSKIDDIKAKYGSQDPFKVPEGYFDTLTSRIMQQIPAQSAVMVPQRNKFRKWLSVAAVSAVVLVGGTLLSTYHSAPAESDALASEQSGQVKDSTYLEDMIDYTLMSDAMIYYEYLNPEENQ